MKQIPFFLHDLGKPELESISEVLSNPILTTGETVERFEELFRAYLKCEFALGVTSCTGALHMSLLALDIGPDDEVITTPMTFVATALAIIESGAKPVFVDVECSTGNIDDSKIEAAITERTKAIMPVHLYGQMCDMVKLREIANRHDLKIIEDAAHCIEGSRDGVKPGQLGDTACFSFYATKNITSGEGGCVVTNDPDVHERLRLLRLHGMTKTAWDRYRQGYEHWDVVLPGWKYNMSNIDAAFLLPQMQRIDENIEKRRRLAAYYRDALSRVPGVRLPEQLPNTRHAHHVYPIWLESVPRDDVITYLRERGIGAVVNYTAVHLFKFFKDEYAFQLGDFPIAERLGGTALSLPFYPAMPFEDVDTVIEVLDAAITDLTSI